MKALISIHIQVKSVLLIRRPQFTTCFLFSNTEKKHKGNRKTVMQEGWFRILITHRVNCRRSTHSKNVEDVEERKLRVWIIVMLVRNVCALHFGEGGNLFLEGSVTIHYIDRYTWNVTWDAVFSKSPSSFRFQRITLFFCDLGVGFLSVQWICFPLFHTFLHDGKYFRMWYAFHFHFSSW